MDVARTSMMHAAAPHFLWPFAVQYAAHQLNLQPRVSLPETSPSLRWTGKVGDASASRVWGSRAFVRDLSVDKLSPCAVPCVLLGFLPDAPGWQFYHPISRRVLSSQDVTFDELMPYYRLFPYRTAPLPPLPHFLALSLPPVDPLPPQGPAPSGVSQVEAVQPVEVAVDSVAARGSKPAGAGSGGAKSGGAETWGAESGGAEPGGAGSGGAEPGGAEPGGAEPGGAGAVMLELELLLLVLVPEVLFLAVLELLGLGVLLGLVELVLLELLAVLVQQKLEQMGVLALEVLLALVLLRVLELVMLELDVLLARELLGVLALVFPLALVRQGVLELALFELGVLLALALRGQGESSLPTLADPESDSLRAASPSVTRLLATVITDPSFESTASSALVAELVDFAACCRLDYAASLVAGSESVYPPSIGGECALSTDVFEDRQEEFQCFAAALPHLVSMLIAPKGDPDAPDIPTPRSYAEAIKGPYSSQWQSAMDAEMDSWKSTGTYVDEVPPPGANIVSGMWIFRVKRPPGSPPVFKARYVARGFTDPSLFLHTDTSLPPFYILVYVDDLVFAIADTIGLAHVNSELQKRHTCTDMGELRSYLGLQITRDRAHLTISLTQSHMVQQVLQRFGFTYSSPQATPLSTYQSLSALPSDESVEPSGPYPELVGCLMYLMICTQPDLAYPLSILARYVAPGRHRPEHLAAASRVLRYVCSTSGMGLVLGGRCGVVLTGHSDASWADTQAMERSSQGYTFSLGSGSVSWRSTRSSSVLSSSCEAEIYAGAMAAQELRWLTYLLTDLGEPPHSPPVLYVDNKAMLALCREHKLEHRTKHIALRYFLARELQQRGQLRLTYVASEANTADIFTKALPPCDHQRFCTMLGLVPTWPHLLTS
ncbi:unnamed protein product [Closterium sp. NIES-64]|nr:unnamed protein product [Closterium sp. NIES-64]